MGWAMNDEVPVKRARRAASPRAIERNRPASRREFLTRIPTAAAMTVAGAAVSFSSSTEADQDPLGGSNGAGNERAADSFQVRLEAAQSEAAVPIPEQITKRDEQNYPIFIGNFSKGLPHNNIGEVARSAYLSFLKAVRQGTA